MSLWAGPDPEGPPFAGDFTDWEKILAGEKMLEEQVVTATKDYPGTFCIFPNPATSQLTISIDIQPGDRPVIEIADVSGRLVVHERAVSGSTVIDTLQLTSGVYIVRLRSLSGVRVQKFVKR
jgi:hypothetical protein